jgi:large subunit ribosomal protein L2
MPKRLKLQRRGRGGNIFRATKRGKGNASYPEINRFNKNSKAQVLELLHDPARTGILAKIMLEDESTASIIAPEGMVVGESICLGNDAGIAIGNIMLLKDIVEGCPIFNVEAEQGDGGSLVRSSGSYALIVTKDEKNVYIKLPSGKTKALKPDCRATIGCSAGGARKEKPFIKAGNKSKAMKGRHRPYPTVRGVAMNPVAHPFGGSQHHAGKSKSTSRNASAGRKVGAIASKRTGRRKKN